MISLYKRLRRKITASKGKCSNTSNPKHKGNEEEAAQKEKEETT